MIAKQIPIGLLNLPSTDGIIMPMQKVTDIFVDASIERGDFEKALRYRWLHHAFNSATFEPDTVAVYLQQMRDAVGSELPTIRE